MSVVAAHHTCVVSRAGRYVDRVHIPPCTRNNAHTNIWYAATTLIIMEYSSF